MSARSSGISSALSSADTHGAAGTSNIDIPPKELTSDIGAKSISDSGISSPLNDKQQDFRKSLMISPGKKYSSARGDNSSRALKICPLSVIGYACFLKNTNYPWKSDTYVY